MIQRVKDWQIDKLIRGVELLKNTLPKDIGNISVSHFRKGFSQGGGQTDDSEGGWEKRKTSTKRDRQTGLSRGILVQTGNLLRSIKVKGANMRFIRIGTVGIPYAQIHNEGLQGRVFGKYSFKMPKREFIGKSKKLDAKIERFIDKEIRRVIKSIQ